MKPERKLRILTVCQGETPSTHIRLYDPLGRMEQAGRLQWRKAYLASLSRADLDWADLILLQRLDNPAGFDAIEIARLYGKPVIYDTDDNWVDPPPEYHPAYVYHSGILVRNTVERYLSKADLVTVSTPALAETFSRFQDRILVVPNTVDFEPPEPPGREGPCVRIGYAGTRTHDGDFEVVVPALVRLRREFGKRIALVFLGCLPPGLDASEVELWGFSDDYKGYLSRLCRLGIQIALAPLRDNPFNRFKSNIKYLEYSLAGAAGVYSRSPAYEGSVQDRITGLLVPHTEEAWYEAVKSLVQEPLLRKGLAAAARRDVAERFSPERTRQAWESAFSMAAREAAGRGRSRAALPSGPRKRKKVLYIGSGFLWPHTYIDEFLVRAFSSLGLEVAFCPLVPTPFYEQTLALYSRFDDRFRESTLLRSLEPTRLLGTIRSENPDFLFTVQGYTIPRDILYEMSRTGIPSAVWLLDEPYDALKSADVGTFFSHVFVQDASSVEHHRKFGNLETHYLPHGFEHLEVHTKRACALRWDLSIVGTGFPRRRRALEAIRSVAGSLLVVGKGWPEELGKDGLERKLSASPSEAARIYNESRINLTVHREETDFSVSSGAFHAVSPNASVFYVAGCGGFQIADDSRQDLQNLFEPGKEIVVYRSLEELADLVSRYLKDGDERARIAEAGRRRALAEHTYAHRLRKVVEILEGSPCKARPRFYDRTEIHAQGSRLGSASPSDRVQVISLSEAEKPGVRSIRTPSDADASSCLNEALFESLAPRAVVVLSDEVDAREAALRADRFLGSNPDLGAVVWRNGRSELVLAVLSMRILHHTGALTQGYRSAGLALEDLLLRMRALGFEVRAESCPAKPELIESSSQPSLLTPEDRERFVRAWGLNPERRLRARRLLRVAAELRAGRRDELALPVLEQALSLDPEWEEAGRELGALLLYRGDARQAEPHLYASWSRDPDHVPGGLLYGLCLLHLKEERKALDVLLPLLERKACLLEKTSLLYNIGRCHRRLGERDQALQRVREAVKLDPSYLRAHQELLSMHVEAQDFAAALECMERIVQIDSKNPEAFNDLGVILHKLGRDREALEAFEKALTIDPSYRPAAKNLEIVSAALAASSPRGSQERSSRRAGAPFEGLRPAEPAPA